MTAMPSPQNHPMGPERRKERDVTPAERIDAPIDVVTFGCRLNSYESEVIRREASQAGLTDTVVVNTCAVTAEAVRQARQAIRKLRRERPEAQIVVTGCAAQVEPARFAEMPEVSAVMGNTEKMDRAAYRRLAPGTNRYERVQVNDIMAVNAVAAHMVGGFAEHSRAFVQVQNGCDHRCTFCIIPYGRGNSRSVPMGEVVSEIQGLVENGYREVVLTGVDLTSYGGDLPGTPRLGRLVRQILRHVPALPRLRLSSIDSIEADDDLMRALAEEERLMPHLHLSLQAGDDMVLKRMKRRHLRADAIRFCEEVRRLRPDVVFGADIIAGFPTETEAMFQRSLDIVDECGLSLLHVFPFSPREGTPAALMPQVDRAIVKARAARLRERGEAAFQATLAHAIGGTADVLVEREGMGHTPGFLPVTLDGIAGPAAMRGAIVPMRITGHDGRALKGVVAGKSREAA